MKRTAFLLLLPILFCSGCFFSDSVDPIYEIDDDDALVVQPFHEPGIDSPWDSTLGHQLAEATSRAMSEKVDFIVRPYSSVLELLVAKSADPKKKAGDDDDDASGPASDDELGPDVRKFTPEKLAALTDSQYVLICKILQFETQDRLSVNMRKGTARIDVRLFKVASASDQRQSAEERNKSLERINKVRKSMDLEPLGKLPYGGRFVAHAIVEAHYPEDFLNQYGDPFLKTSDIRAGLIQSTAEEIARLWYEHDREPLKGLRGKGTGN